MRISLIYPGETWSTFDVARGYETALRALGHEVSVFDYHTQLAFYHQYLGWLSREKGMAFPPDAAGVLASERVAIEVIDRLPDVVLIVKGMNLHRRGYELLYRLGIPRVLILTECPYNDDEQWTILEKGHINLAFANDQVSVYALRTAGVRVLYLPHSFDPQRHCKRAVGPEMQTDVFFHGTIWPERDELFAQLDLGAYKAHISGVRPGFLVNAKRFTISDRDTIVDQVVDNDELALWYSGARIVLNPHRTVKTAGDHIGRDEAWSLGPRAYEVAACGAFQITDERRELREVFGDCVPTYTDAADLQRKIEYYLAHDDERQAMADEAHTRVQQCTFEHRAREILVPAIEEVL